MASPPLPTEANAQSNPNPSSSDARYLTPMNSNASLNPRSDSITYATRPRSGSVRVKRMNRRSFDSPEISPLRPPRQNLNFEHEPTVPETEELQMPSQSTVPSSNPPPLSSTPVTANNTSTATPINPNRNFGGRGRAKTITQHLWEGFEATPTKTSETYRFGEGPGISTSNSLRARGVSIGSATGRRPSIPSEYGEEILEPSVVLSHPSTGNYPPETGNIDPQEAEDLREHHDQDEVDLLDVLDAKVATAAYLSNVANGLAVP